MSGWDLSVLNLLRKAAVKLNIFQEYRPLDIYEMMSESEIASIIHQHYQNNTNEDKTNAENKKGETELCADFKNLKIDLKRFDDLSGLELLPNEVYENILSCLGAEDKKNLRMTCKGLYEQTTLMDEMFHDWCYNVYRTNVPDFVLNSDKKICVKLRFDPSADPTPSDIGNFINRYSHRISSLYINAVEEPQHYSDTLMVSLTNMKPAEFPYLTSLDLNALQFDNDSLLQLAPQLEHLKLSNCTPGFDLSSVREEDQCFTRLKTLNVFDCHIDLKKILTKSCKTLKALELKTSFTTRSLFDFGHEFSSLEYLWIILNSKWEEKFLRNLFTKASKTLKTLVLTISSSEEIDISTLLQQPMKITSLKVAQVNTNLDQLLKSCPLIQNLTLHYLTGEIKDTVLKDLQYLFFHVCNVSYISNVLKVASQSPLRTLKIVDPDDELENCEFPLIPKLERVCIEYDATQTQELDHVLNLFPGNVEVDWETNVRVEMSDDVTLSHVITRHMS